MKRLAIITTHPIQYNAPLFELLHARGNINVKVFYTWGVEVLQNKYDPGFAKTIEWDIPLLEGYEYTFVQNIATQKGSHHFWGINNPTLIDEIKAYKADAVLLYGWSFKSHLKAMRYFKGKLPVFFRGDSTLLDDDNSVKKVIKYYFLRWIYRQVDKSFFVGRNNEAYYLKYGINPNNLIWAPHSIDNDRFQPSSQNILWAQEKKGELGIPKDSLVFLYAGKLESKKNPLLLLQAFKEIANKKYFLIIVGNGPMEEELKNSFKDLSNLFFLDFQNQMIMPAIYQLCDVFVLPSQGPGETWGLAINEAMASGKPILVSNKCGGAIDLVKDNINGYVFKSGDLKDLTDKMVLLATSNNLQKMGQDSQVLISKWSFDKTCYQIEKSVLSLK